MSEELLDEEENFNCPSCHINIASSPRTSCPFCGSFFDLNDENNLNHCTSALSPNDQAYSNNDHRLPRIHSQRGNIFRVTGFGPFLNDSFNVIHSYLTSLFFKQNSDDNLYFRLPPIYTEYSSSNRSNPLIRSDTRSSQSTTNSKSKNSTELKENYSSKYWDIEKFRSMVENAYEEDNFIRVHQFYEEIFSSLIELNTIFKQESNSEETKLHDPLIKMDLMLEVFNRINELPPIIYKTVLNSIISSLTQCPRLKVQDEVRGMFMLIQLPIFVHQSSYNVFAYLLRRILNLHGTAQQLLIHWFSRLDPEMFRTTVKNILQFITIREFPPVNSYKLPSINKSRWWIPCAVKVLSLLNIANDKNNPSIIPFTEFYNSALDHINLMSEYQRWQNPTKNKKFSYCQYPFILSVVAKKSILQHDSEQQMISNARRSLLNHAIYQNMPDNDVFFLNLNVRRSNLVVDSLREIARKQHDLKKKLKVTFIGEPGLDMGGLTKEWFLLLIKEIFHQDYGMFVYHNKARCYWFSTSQTGNLNEYNLIGVVSFSIFDDTSREPTYLYKKLMGLAVYNSIILDLHFPKACYKKLLCPSIINEDPIGLCKLDLQQFAEVMPDVAIGLKELLSYQGNVEEDFCMNFQVSVEEFGKSTTHILKPGGENIHVNNQNREEFVKLYIDLILNKAIYKPFKAFYLGFHSICASNVLILLRPEEIEMLVCGSPTIDLEELRKVTIYDGYQEDEPIIKEFWEIVKSFSLDLQKQFLRFVTGSDRVPAGGMSEMMFKLSSISYCDNMLPTSHTCFNQLVLPRYKNANILREKLVIAISNAEGFGLE